MGIDAGARKVLEIGREGGSLPFERESPEAARLAYRESYLASQGPKVAVAFVGDIAIPGGGGPITVRVYKGGRTPPRDAPLIVYVHGGGWVIGDLDSHDEICRLIADLSGAVVLCPDYRLAPEHKFPMGLEDCATTVSWAHSHGDELGIDPDRVTVAGDSAGGNLAAVLALMPARGELPTLVTQLLIYPNTDARQNADSYRRYAEGFGLTTQTMRWFRDHYVRSNADIEDWRVSPLLSGSFAGAPPAFVAVAGHDILADEGEAYAQTLREAHVRVVRKRWAKQIHGFASMGRYVSDAEVVIKEAIASWAVLTAT